MSQTYFCPGAPGCTMRDDMGRLPSPGASCLSGVESCKLGVGRGAPALSSQIWSRAPAPSGWGGGHRGPWLPFSSGPTSCLPLAQVTTGDQWLHWSGSPHLLGHSIFPPTFALSLTPTHYSTHPSSHLPTCLPVHPFNQLLNHPFIQSPIHPSIH